MIEIKPATLRDASWVTAYMRAIDREECYAQLPDDLPTAILANWLIHNSRAYIAYRDGQPAALFGTAAMTVNCFSVWAIGTGRMLGTIPAVTAFFLEREVPARIEEGFNCAEARSIWGHDSAHRWIESLGGEQLGGPFPYGKRGEAFLLYRWTVAGYRSISRQTNGVR